MTDKRDVKKDSKNDSREDSDPKVRAVVIEDLDVPSPDKDSIRGGITVSHCANPKQGS